MSALSCQGNPLSQYNGLTLVAPRLYISFPMRGVGGGAMAGAYTCNAATVHATLCTDQRAGICGYSVEVVLVLSKERERESVQGEMPTAMALETG